MFVPGKFFQSGLIFSGKTSFIPSYEHPIGIEKARVFVPREFTQASIIYVSKPRDHIHIRYLLF